MTLPSLSFPSFHHLLLVIINSKEINVKFTAPSRSSNFYWERDKYILGGFSQADKFNQMSFDEKNSTK
jgi:hypothetical protein